MLGTEWEDGVRFFLDPLLREGKAVARIFNRDYWGVGWRTGVCCFISVSWHEVDYGEGLLYLLVGRVYFV